MEVFEMAMDCNPLNRAARLMDVAHGCQVVCSSATASHVLVGDSRRHSGRARLVAGCEMCVSDAPSGAKHDVIDVVRSRDCPARTGSFLVNFDVPSG